MYDQFGLDKLSQHGPYPALILLNLWTISQKRNIEVYVSYKRAILYVSSRSIGSSTNMHICDGAYVAAHTIIMLGLMPFVVLGSLSNFLPLVLFLSSSTYSEGCYGYRLTVQPILQFNQYCMLDSHDDCIFLSKRSLRLSFAGYCLHF